MSEVDRRFSQMEQRLRVLEKAHAMSIEEKVAGGRNETVLGETLKQISDRIAGLERETRRHTNGGQTK